MTTQEALERAVLEIESHVADLGWDSPARLFALVRTAEALGREPALAEQLPAGDATAAAADPDHLLSVEQDELDSVGGTEDLETLLARIAWPQEVAGVALTVERLVLPAGVEEQAPDDEAEAIAWLATHPQRQEVRLAAGVLRDGSRSCAIRSRNPDDPVLSGPDLLPNLTDALASTLGD